MHYGLDAPPEPWGPPGGPELPAETPVLVAVCRLVPQKGVDLAVEALVRIREQHPAAHLVVLGEGPLRAELTELAVARGVADAVSFPDGSETSPGGFAERPSSSIPRAGRGSDWPCWKPCSASEPSSRAA